ncbi:MAG: hypothetical protein FK730_09735 [Asgard group archaeon]|nr:hypothetical protein [Asgard group archaeon]
MTEHYTYFFVRALENGSLFVGPKYKTLEEAKEREEIMLTAHKTLKDAAIDVSRILTDEYYGEIRFYINNRLEDALEILHEIDNDY